jgi:cell division septum initiation protein DivIVA
MTVVDDVTVHDITADDVASEDIVPLAVGFDVVLRGYDRGQVQHYVQASETGLRLLTTDRDAAVRRAEDLARQVESQRREIADLRSRLDRICRAPVNTDGLTERLRRMVDLAREEAAEITATARAAAQQSWQSTQRATDRLRERCERLAAELDSRRQQMETEHRQLLQQTQAELRALTDRAEHHRRQLDERAAAQRRLVDGDFRIAMAARRKQTLDELAALRASAHAEADRLVAQARERSRRQIAEAERQVEALVEVRQRVAAQLRAAERVLAQADQLLRQLPDEEPRADAVVLAEAS